MTPRRSPGGHQGFPAAPEPADRHQGMQTVRREDFMICETRAGGVTLKSHRGACAGEFTLIAPVFTVLFGMVDLSRIFCAGQDVVTAAREAAPVGDRRRAVRRLCRDRAGADLPALELGVRAFAWSAEPSVGGVDVFWFCDSGRKLPVPGGSAPRIPAGPSPMWADVLVTAIIARAAPTCAGSARSVTRASRSRPTANSRTPAALSCDRAGQWVATAGRIPRSW